MYKFGDTVSVKAFPNRILQRKVVRVENNQTVLLCNDAEFQSALRAHKQPSAIGFPIADVISVDKSEYSEV